MESAYRKLIAHLQTWAMGFPEAPETEVLPRRRVSAEEADLLANLPFFPHTLEQLGLLLRQTPDRLVPRLDGLSRRGLIFRHESKNTVRYALNDSRFDFYRSPFWAGTDDEESRRVAALANRYFEGPCGPEFGAYPTMGLRRLRLPVPDRLPGFGAAARRTGLSVEFPRSGAAHGPGKGPGHYRPGRELKK